ncbi:MAG TPA: hypothetical protein VGK74_26625 [Symbiobacteriaceae bacterium]|jgi:hypothetical protein
MSRAPGLNRQESAGAAGRLMKRVYFVLRISFQIEDIKSNMYNVNVEPSETVAIRVVLKKATGAKVTIFRRGKLRHATEAKATAEAEETAARTGAKYAPRR